MANTVVCPECHSTIVLAEHPKTVTRSFRIDEAALGALEEEALKKSSSVNTVLNQQILSFSEYDRFFSKVGMVKFSASTLQNLINAAPDERLIEAAVASALDTPGSIMRSKYGKVTLDTTLEYVKMVSEFGNMYECAFADLPDGKVITLSHRFGPKGSLFWANYVKTLFEQIGYVPKIKTSANSVSFEILPKRTDASFEF
jgi:hypothetical protein